MRFKTCLSVIAVMLAISCLVDARESSDFTNDSLLNASAPSMTDSLDFMIWNHYKFTAHLMAVPDFGDGNLDTVVDVSDFNLWNSARYTGDGNGSCDAAVSACVSDSDYFQLMTNAPHTFSTAGGTSPFSKVQTASEDTLHLDLPPNTTLHAFAVVASSAATNFGANFMDNVLFQNSYQGPPGTFVVTDYFNGRQQWATPFPLNDVGGWDHTTDGLVATFAPNALDSASVIYQLSTGVGSAADNDPRLITYFASGLSGPAVGLLVPEPSSWLGAVLALCMIGCMRTAF